MEEAIKQLLISLGPVALALLAVWRMLVQARITREEEDRKLRAYFQGELAKRDERIQERDTQIEELRDAQFVSQQRIAVLNSEVRDAKRYRDEADARAAQLAQDVIKLQAQITDLLVRLNEAQAQLAELPLAQAEIETLKRQLVELRDELELKRRENQTLREENSKLARENHEYEQRIVGLNARINDMQGEVSRLALRIGQLERENHQLEKKVQNKIEEESS